MKHLQKALLFSWVSLFSLTPATAAEDARSEETSRNPSGWRASDLIGSTVKNSSNENIGAIEDLLIDAKTGKVISIIVSTGGFLGIADTLSAVPASSFQFDEKAKAYRVALSKEELASGEKYTADEWKAASVAKLKEVRDAIGGDVSKPDNSARNEGDLDENAITPLDQGNSEADIKLTKDIRSAVVASDLSFNAKNIKIISKDRQVVLRGVVQTEEERQEVLRIAKDHAGGAHVIDEISVKK